MAGLTIITDLDNIIIDLLRPWISWYNITNKDDLTIDEMTSYKFEDHAKPGSQIYKFFDTTFYDYYSECSVLPGAAKALEAIHQDGHDIIVSTAVAGRTAHLKWDLAKKAMPWIPENNIMVGSRKEKLYGDVFIDDAPKNLIKYKNAWPSAHVLTIGYPYNQDCRNIVNLFAEDHNNTEKAWSEIYNYISNLYR